MTTDGVSPPKGPHDPNPGFGKTLWKDIPGALLGTVMILIHTGFFCVRRAITGSRNPRPWKEDLKRIFVRKSLANLPLSVLRQPRSLQHYHTSPRYGNTFSTFISREETPSFSGIWLPKPGLGSSAGTGGKPIPASEADMVILFIHGGGYIGSQPAQWASFLLRIAETIASSSAAGTSASPSSSSPTVGIFALDYSVAPESPFPRQMEQAAACWDFLTNVEGIAPAKLALMGDSAGGSICLSLLVHLADRAAKSKTPTPTPGRGLFLVSPWISIFDETGYAEKAADDLLDASALRSWARLAVHGVDKAPAKAKRTKEGETNPLRYLEFASPVEGRPLCKFLPPRVWVSAGGDELFLDNMHRFVDAAREAGVGSVELIVEKDAPHDWQLFQAIENEKEFLKLPFGTPDDGLLGGADAIGRAVVAGG